MQGIGIVGDHYADSKASSCRHRPLPARPLTVPGKNLARMLKLLQNSEVAATALLDGVSALPKSSQKQEIMEKLKKSLDEMRNKSWDSCSHDSRALAVARITEDAVQTVIAKVDGCSRVDKSNPQHHKNPGMDMNSPLWAASSKRSNPQSMLAMPRKSPIGGPTTCPFEIGTREFPQGTTVVAGDSASPDCQNTVLESKAALVSDSEGGWQGVHQTTKVTEIEEQLATADFWPVLLEAVSLHVSSFTTRTWGRKKTYEVYRLAGPTRPVTNLDKDRSRISKEFLKLYDGITLKARDGHHLFSQCRVHAVQRSNPAALWVQLKIGSSFDIADDGDKKRKNDTTLIAVIPPDSGLIALTASRAASRCRFTRYFLKALEAVLTCSGASGHVVEDFLSSRLDGVSGTEPFDLVRAAKSIDAGIATGRFSSLASNGSALDPISDLEQAANSNLLFRENDKNKRMKVAQRNSRGVAKLSSLIHVSGGSSVAAVDKAAVIVDHSARQQATRKRRRDEQFGFAEHCPRRECIRWEWEGYSKSAATCWQSDNDLAHGLDLPSHKIKCGVTMRGSDVLAGMRALMESGLMDAPLPNYIRDAPLYTDGTISVVDQNAIYSSKKALK